MKKPGRKANAEQKSQSAALKRRKKRSKLEDKTAQKKSCYLLEHGRGELELGRAGAGKELVHRVVTGTREGKAIYRWGAGCKGEN